MFSYSISRLFSHGDVDSHADVLIQCCHQPLAHDSQGRFSIENLYLSTLSMLKLFNNFITCISCVTRVFHCVRSQKEQTSFLISCFHMLVAEHITFDVYAGCLE